MNSERNDNMGMQPVPNYLKGYKEIWEKDPHAANLKRKISRFILSM